MSESSIAGLKILVVEDDFLVAKALAEMIESMGAEVVGPASGADEACRMVKRERIDVAILDITLTPGSSAPVARALLYRNRPFIFVTGYGNIQLLPDELRGYIVLAKPVDAETLRAAIANVMRGAESGARK
jgi:DNA-binding NtrC family response regulator